MNATTQRREHAHPRRNGAAQEKRRKSESWQIDLLQSLLCGVGSLAAGCLKQ